MLDFVARSSIVSSIVERSMIRLRFGSTCPTKKIGVKYTEVSENREHHFIESRNNRSSRPNVPGVPGLKKLKE